MESEQITKTPDVEIKSEEQEDKKKDPKKVAAGKKLAKLNKEARDFKNQNLNQKKEEEMSQFSLKDVGNNIIYFGSIIGAGFTIYQSYLFYKNLPSKKKVTFEEEEEEEKPKRKEITIDMD